MKAASTTVNIPTPLRQFADGNSSVGVAGKSVGDALGDLTRKYPDLNGAITKSRAGYAEEHPVQAKANFSNRDGSPCQTQREQ